MIDVLAIGAHPDDVEAGAAGFLIKAKKSGHQTGLIILTQGEAGAFGGAEARAKEAADAASLMGVDYYQMMDYKDAGLECNLAGAEKLAEVIRELKPKIVLCPWRADYHPDHVAAHHLVNQAIFIAGRSRDGSAVWAPQQTLYFSIDVKSIAPADFILDITDVWNDKKNALLAHGSQYGPILQTVEMLGSYYGIMSGTRYGEGFIKEYPLRLRGINELIQ